MIQQFNIILLKRKFITLSIKIFFVFLIFVSCAQPDKIVIKEVTYQAIQSAKCKTDTINKYHILLPENLIDAEKLPLVVAIDAHGDGKMAVEKFLPAVKFFPCIVVGSDLIENNFIGYESAIIQLINDIKSRYPVNESEIVVSGFSGGARMAYNFTLRHNVKGVLMCGAGPGNQLPKCPIYAISGMGDFNFSENYIPPSNELISDKKITVDYFYGNHEWPQPTQLSDGLVLLFSANNSSFNKIRNQRSNELINAADSLEKSGNYWMAWKALEKSAKLAENKRTKDNAVNKAEKLMESQAFLSSVQTLEKDLKAEASLQQAYAKRSLTESFTWWKNELTVLDNNLAKYTIGMKADHYLRIKGYVGILLYSRINNMIYSDTGNPQLNVLLEAYQFAEPENSYAYYFQALHFFKLKNNKVCIENLDKSIKLGFTDFEKMRKDFPIEILKQVEKDD